MSNRVHCQNCGSRVEVPAGYTRAKIRCPGCGYYAEVPPELRSAPEPDPEPSPPPRRAEPPRRPAAPDSDDAPWGEDDQPARAKPVAARPVRQAKPPTNPRDARPRFDSDDPAAPPLLEGTQDENDDKPYGVPGTGTKLCRHCRGELPLDAELCVHCGRELTGGSKAGRTYQSISREWEEGWPLQLRLQLFVACVVLDVIAFLVLTFTEGMPPGILGIFPQVALQAFLLGSFDTFGIKRTTKGSVTMTRTRRLCFYALKPDKLKWKDSEGVGIIATHNPGVFSWLMCAYLAMFCLVPGALFYWFVIRPERFEVALCDVYGTTNEIVYRSKDREQAAEVAEVISEATGLWSKKVM